MDKSFIALIIASTILLASLAGTAWYKNQQNHPLEITSQSKIDKSCDLNLLECRSIIEKVGQISLSITPRPIPLVSTLSLIVKSNIENIKQVMIDFKGVDMDMGPNQVILKRGEDGGFYGKGMLPVCIRSSMNWKAFVYVKTLTGLYMAPYLFETRK